MTRFQGLNRLLYTLLLVLYVIPTSAETSQDDAIADLERRIAELEAAEQDQERGPDPSPTASSQFDLGLPDWTRHVKLGGSANTGYYWGAKDSVYHEVGFEVWDARFFIDAELGRDLKIAEHEILRDVGFSFEWDLVRLGSLQNGVGELYVDFQGIAGSSWANLQVGRAEIPVGENYLRFDKGYAETPFISNTIGGPWFWDEGIRIHGADPDARFGYIASIMDGETSFNADSNADPQYTLKLFAKPTRWLHLSVSGLYQDTVGSRNSPANGALWLGEMWAKAFGSSTNVANYVNGNVVPDGPNRIDQTYLLGADAIVTFERARLWLAYGTYKIDQKGTLYDRRLHYWIAELILDGNLLIPELKDVYLGLRVDGLGTYDSSEGYLLDFRRRNQIGYNAKSQQAYSVVIGWKLLRYVTLRAEYAHTDIDLVKGLPRTIRRHGGDTDSAAIEVGVHF